MGADAAAADDNDEGVAELLQAVVFQEDPVAGELLEDEFLVKVAGLGSPGESLVAGILLVYWGRCGAIPSEL